MKLTYEQICSVTVGAAYVEQIENSVNFHRFTKEQENIYKGYREDFYLKTFATPGIRLEFFTDSRSLALALRSVACSNRTHLSFTIFCDDTLLSSQGTLTDPNRAFSVYHTLPKGEKKIRIYFPWTTVGVLDAIALDDGATLRPVEKSCRILQFGDSITQGYQATEPHLTYASLVADALNAHARNKGIGGEVFFPPLSALRDDGFEPDYITVAYGTNDWSHSEKDTFDRNCRQFYHNLSATYPNAKIFAIAPIWRETEHLQKPIGKPLSYIKEYFQTVADELPNVTVIDGYGFLPKEPACFMEDLLHPNDLGFDYYAKALVKELKKHIDA